MEKWEYKQLMQAGVLDVREHPLFGGGGGGGGLGGFAWSVGCLCGLGLVGRSGGCVDVLLLSDVSLPASLTPAGPSRPTPSTPPSTHKFMCCDPPPLPPTKRKPPNPKRNHPQPQTQPPPTPNATSPTPKTQRNHPTSNHPRPPK